MESPERNPKSHRELDRKKMGNKDGVREKQNGPLWSTLHASCATHQEGSCRNASRCAARTCPDHDHHCSIQRPEIECRNWQPAPKRCLAIRFPLWSYISCTYSCLALPADRRCRHWKQRVEGSIVLRTRNAWRATHRTARLRCIFSFLARAVPL
jgi:hypothetical protein